MITNLIEIAKSLDGKLLVIGSLDDKVNKVLEKNKKLIMFDHLTENTKKKGKRKFFGNKSINVKKIYKELKKQKYDYLICDFSLIKNNLNNFIRNSYKLINKKIYFILDESIYNYDELIKRYERYNASSISKGIDGMYLITIDMCNMKMNIMKQFLYSFRDFGYNVIEFIASVIIS